MRVRLQRQLRAASSIRAAMRGCLNCQKISDTTFCCTDCRDTYRAGRDLCTVLSLEQRAEMMESLGQSALRIGVRK